MLDFVFCVLGTMHYVYCIWQSGIWIEEQQQAAPDHPAAAADASDADNAANAA
jgi:hypothetical protein